MKESVAKAGRLYIHRAHKGLDMRWRLGVASQSKLR